MSAQSRRPSRAGADIGRRSDRTGSAKHGRRRDRCRRSPRRSPSDALRRKAKSIERDPQHLEMIGSSELQPEIVEAYHDFIHSPNRKDLAHPHDRTRGFEQNHGLRTAPDRSDKSANLILGLKKRQHENFGLEWRARRRSPAAVFALTGRGRRTNTLARVTAAEMPARSSKLCPDSRVPRPFCRASLPNVSRSTPIRSTPARSAAVANAASSVIKVRQKRSPKGPMRRAFRPPTARSGLRPFQASNADCQDRP